MNFTDQISENVMPAKTQEYWYEKSQENVLADDMVQDEKYQDITYFKFDKINNVNIKDKFIDFPKAAIEMRTLSVYAELGSAFIGFTNMRTREILQFLRREDDLWYADIPINSSVNWNKYLWGCTADTKSVLSTLELFFEGASWFDTLPFTMRRSKR